jgi:hypothetical protein
VVFANAPSCFSWDSSYYLLLILLYVGLRVCNVLFSSRGLPLYGERVVCTNDLFNIANDELCQASRHFNYIIYHHNRHDCLFRHMNLYRDDSPGFNNRLKWIKV